MKWGAMGGYSDGRGIKSQQINGVELAVGFLIACDL
jgi:hypothetical protein